MLKVYYFVCIFALCSNAHHRPSSKIESYLRSSRKLDELLIMSSFTKDRSAKAVESASEEDPYVTCSEPSKLLRSSMNISDESETNVPLLLVKIAIQNETHFVLTQENLCGGQSNNTEYDIGSQWVAIKLQNGGMKPTQEYFQMRNTSPFHLPGNASSELVVIRTEPHIDGLFVLYEERLFNGILDQLKKNRSAVPALVRMEMLTDYFYFAGLGLRDYEPFFNLSSNLIDSDEDPSLFEWWAFLTLIQVIGNQHRLQTHPTFLRANNLFESKINSRFSTPNFESQLEYIAQQTGQTWPWPCLHLDSRCRDRLNKGLQYWKSNSTSTVESITEQFGVISGYSTECLIVASGGQEAFDFMLAKAEKGQVSYQALGCVTEPDLVKLLLSKVIDPNDANFQTANIRRKVWAYYVAYNKGVGSLKFIRENLQAFDDLYGGDAILNNVVAIFHWVSTKEQLKEIQEFIKIDRIQPDQYFLLSLLFEDTEETIGNFESEWRRKAILQWLTKLVDGNVN